MSSSVSQVCSLTLRSSIVPLPTLPIIFDRFSLGEPFLMMSFASVGVIKSYQKKNDNVIEIVTFSSLITSIIITTNREQTYMNDSNMGLQAYDLHLSRTIHVVGLVTVAIFAVQILGD